MELSTAIATMAIVLGAIVVAGHATGDDANNNPPPAQQAAQQSHSFFGKFVTRFDLPRTEKAEGSLICTFDHVLVTSSGDRKALLQLPTSGKRPSLISVLPNGVDLEYFHPNAEYQREPDTILFLKITVVSGGRCITQWTGMIPTLPARLVLPSDRSCSMPWIGWMAGLRCAAVSGRRIKLNRRPLRSRGRKRITNQSFSSRISQPRSFPPFRMNSTERWAQGGAGSANPLRVPIPFQVKHSISIPRLPISLRPATMPPF